MIFRARQQIYNTELPLALARARMQMSNKHNLVLYIAKELVEKTRNLGFNLSKTFENYLKRLLTQFSTVNSVNNNGNSENVDAWWTGLEPATFCSSSTLNTIKAIAY
jgi:post-segregation antitoxin (ccd killing protein)